MPDLNEENEPTGWLRSLLINEALTLFQNHKNGLQTLRGNLDACKISSPRVSWLLVYNKVVLTFRKAVIGLVRDFFDPLEGLLRLRDRGALGLTLPG